MRCMLLAHNMANLFALKLRKCIQNTYVFRMTDEVVPVVRVAAPEKKLSNSGFGLGHHFKNLADTRNHHPSVPEPWGGFEPIQPMLPWYAVDFVLLWHVSMLAGSNVTFFLFAAEGLNTHAYMGKQTGSRKWRAR